MFPKCLLRKVFIVSMLWAQYFGLQDADMLNRTPKSASLAFSSNKPSILYSSGIKNTNWILHIYQQVYHSHITKREVIINLYYEV